MRTRAVLIFSMLPWLGCGDVPGGGAPPPAICIEDEPDPDPDYGGGPQTISEVHVEPTPLTYLLGKYSEKFADYRICAPAGESMRIDRIVASVFYEGRERDVLPMMKNIKLLDHRTGKVLGNGTTVPGFRSVVSGGDPPLPGYGHAPFDSLGHIVEQGRCAVIRQLADLTPYTEAESPPTTGQRIMAALLHSYTNMANSNPAVVAVGLTTGRPIAFNVIDKDGMAVRGAYGKVIRPYRARMYMGWAKNSPPSGPAVRSSAQLLASINFINPVNAGSYPARTQLLNIRFDSGGIIAGAPRDLIVYRYNTKTGEPEQVAKRTFMPGERIDGQVSFPELEFSDIETESGRDRNAGFIFDSSDFGPNTSLAVWAENTDAIWSDGVTYNIPLMDQSRCNPTRVPRKFTYSN